MSFAPHLHQRPVIFQVTQVKQLDERRESVLAARVEVGCDVVELTEELGEGDVPDIVKVGLTENKDAVLFCS